MKKTLLILILILVGSLVSCQGDNQDIIYTDDESIVIEMTNDSLRIL